MKLVPCTGCARHVRCEEETCPFCGTSTAPCFVDADADAAPPVALSRAALLFLGASAVAACGKTDRAYDPEPVAVYGPPPMMVDAAIPMIEAPSIQDAGTQPVTQPDAGKRK